MSREEVRLEGYQPGNGFRSADFRLSLRDFLRTLPLVVALMILFQLRNHLGARAAIAFLIAPLGAAFLVGGVREILHPERLTKGATAQGARRVRIEGVAQIVI